MSWVKSGKVIFTSHKYWEFEVFRDIQFTNWVYLGFRLNRRTDHAGLTINVELAGFSVGFMVYDSRHWDHTTNDWAIGDIV